MTGVFSLGPLKLTAAQFPPSYVWPSATNTMPYEVLSVNNAFILLVSYTITYVQRGIQ